MVGKNNIELIKDELGGYTIKVEDDTGFKEDFYIKREEALRLDELLHRSLYPKK